MWKGGGRHGELSCDPNAIFGGIRVTEKEEIEGLDIGEHGMEAYPDFASASN